MNDSHGGSSASAKVAIAVVSWNTRRLLGRCLDSLRPDAESGLAEVWVVDNASSDGSGELVASRYPWVRLIASETNLGFGPAVNLVASRSTTAWVAPANADIEVDPGALAALVAEGEAHPEAAVVAPRLILPDGSTQQSILPFPTVPFTLAYVSGLVGISRRLQRHWSFGAGFDRDHAQEVPWAVGAFLLVRRTAWNDVGGFDDAQWMYAEDLDLGWRIMRAGWKSRYTPAARILHHESAATTAAWGESRHARWHASTYSWLLRRRGPLIARSIAVINIVGFAARAALTLGGGITGHDPWHGARRAALSAMRSHGVGLRSRRVLERVR